MAREARRTLHSLSSAYQRGVRHEDYDILVVDNGSAQPLDAAEIAAFGPNFQYVKIPASDAKPSPCAAINAAVASTYTPYVAVMIDGARIASPGCVALALLALDQFPCAVVATIGLHLGPFMQKWAAEARYDAATEDCLLESINWPDNGYRMFEISALTGVNWMAWLGPMAESNLIFLPRTIYDSVGGLDEGFDLPGGEIANLDFYNRVSEQEGVTLVSLFGEATFHQIHGGTMSSLPAEQTKNEVALYLERFQNRRGAAFRFSTRQPLLFGPMRPEIKQLLALVLDPNRTGPMARPNALPTRHSEQK